MLLALLLLAAAPEEGRGSVGSTPEEAQAARPDTRVRLGLGGAALFGYSNYSPAVGVGLAFDLGAVITDRLSLFLHVEVGSIVFTTLGSGGVVVEYGWGEHVTTGLGVAFTAWAPTLYGSYASFYGFTFPLRLNFAPSARQPHETAHKGLLIGLQVAPGVSLQATDYNQLRTPLPPEPAIAASVSVSYAWW